MGIVRNTEESETHDEDVTSDSVEWCQLYSM